jgi:hypothetical protein
VLEVVELVILLQLLLHKETTVVVVAVMQVEVEEARVLLAQMVRILMVETVETAQHGQ